MTQNQLIEKQRRFLLIYAERKGVSQACKAFGVSRTTFYKIKTRFLETGSIAPKPKRRPRMPNEIALSKKKLLLELVKQYPMRGPKFYAYCFRERGIEIVSTCLWYHLRRFGLNHRYKRLVYLEKLRHKGQPLTERTLKEVRHHCQTIQRGLWPGHIVALDTFFVGSLKGVGRIYQVTGIDLCSRFGWARLYTNKGHDSTTDFVENQLLPKFYDNHVDCEAVLTDNGTEFTGSKFQQLLADYEIQHHRIPPGKPIYNGYCERFQRTIFEEFYQKVFREKFFRRTEALQEELDRYLVYYNFKRPHFGISPKGTIPMDCFKSKRAFLRQRFQKLLT